MRPLDKFNPLFMLVIFSILLFLMRNYFFTGYSDEALVKMLQDFLAIFGVMGIVYLLGLYFLCSFFFVPILIPLNIACGALYGPLAGSGIALAGIIISCLASTLSVRYVFRGMGSYAANHRDVKKFLNQISRHGTVVILMIKLAFIVPYLLQNIVLAMTALPLHRLLLLTLVGAVPGVISYSYIGAGLVNLDNAGIYGVYLLVPVMLLVLVSLGIHSLRRHTGIGRQED